MSRVWGFGVCGSNIGAFRITHTFFGGGPCYNHSIMGPKPYSRKGPYSTVLVGPVCRWFIGVLGYGKNAEKAIATTAQYDICRRAALPEGPGRVLGPKIHTLNGFWTLKPLLFGYLDQFTLNPKPLWYP